MLSLVCCSAVAHSWLLLKVAMLEKKNNNKPVLTIIISLLEGSSDGEWDKVCKGGILADQPIQLGTKLANAFSVFLWWGDVTDFLFTFQPPSNSKILTSTKF